MNMMTDEQANVLYYADTLPKKYPEFFADYKRAITELGITPNPIPGTRDVWAKITCLSRSMNMSLYCSSTGPITSCQRPNGRRRYPTRKVFAANWAFALNSVTLFWMQGMSAKGYRKAILCDKVFGKIQPSPKKPRSST